MNIETTKTSSAATAILSSNEMGSTLSVQNMKSSQSKSSFQEQLKSASKEETQKFQEAEAQKQEENKKTAEAQASQKAEKKAAKETAKAQKEEAKQTEQAEQNSQTQQLNGEISVVANGENDAFSMLSDQVKSFVLKNGGQFNLNNINLMTATTRAEISNIQPAVDYTSIQMSDTDALFFSNLVKNTDMSMQSIASEFQKTLSNGTVLQAQSSAKATAALITALQESAKTNQPFRIDFDKDVSVILQVGKDGNINANFIPGDKAVEAYLRNNIDFLKQRFNEENIAYGDLNYSKSRQDKEGNQQRRKEQNNE